MADTTRKDSNYGDLRGYSAKHCGPNRRWQEGDCRHFRAPDACTEVSGTIRPRGLCDWWKPTSRG